MKSMKTKTGIKSGLSLPRCMSLHGNYNVIRKLYFFLHFSFDYMVYIAINYFTKKKKKKKKKFDKKDWLSKL